MRGKDSEPGMEELLAVKALSKNDQQRRAMLGRYQLGVFGDEGRDLGTPDVRIKEDSDEISPYTWKKTDVA